MIDVIGPLGVAITALPAGPSQPGLNAGPCFRFSRDLNILPHQAAAWTMFIERLKELAAYCGFLRVEGELASVLTSVRGALNLHAEHLQGF